MRFSIFLPMNNFRYLPLFVLLFSATSLMAQFNSSVVNCVGGNGFIQFNNVEACDSAYTWSIDPPIGTLAPTANEAVYDIAWNVPGTTEICVVVSDSCAGTAQEFCTTMEVNDVPQTSLFFNVCNGECVNVAASQFCQPGDYQVILQSAQGCDSIINVLVSVFPPFDTDLGEVPIPCGGSFEICGQVFTETGVLQTALCTGFFGCDSLVNFTLVPDDVVADAGPEMFLDCANTSAVLNGSASSQGPEFTYQWTGPNGFASTTLNPVASDPGVYCLEVVNTVLGCTATDCMEVVFVADTEPIVSVFPSALPCDGEPLELVADYFGGNVTFAWSTPDGNIVSGGSSIAPLVDAAGTYCLVVTDDDTGCSDESCAYVYPKPHVIVTGPSVVCPLEPTTYTAQILSTQAQESLFYSINGGPVEEVIDIGGGPLSTITVELSETSTLIEVWGTDLGGCETDTAEVYVEVSDYDLVFNVDQNGCMPAQVSIEVVGELIFPPIAFTWSNGLFGNTINTLDEGWYYVTTTDAIGCVEVDSVYITPDYTGNCALIQGNVLEDVNTGCTAGTDDLPLSGWLVQAVGAATFYGTTDDAGNYSIPVDPGDYVLSVFPPNEFWSPCENDVAVTLANVDDVATVDFLLEKLPGCPLLTIDISTSQLRRCFPENFYHVSFCNEGVEDATDAYVTVQLDADLSFLASSIPGQDLGNNQYQFDIGDVAVGECGTFTIEVFVDCASAFGQTHCTEAHIYPDTLCSPPDPLWSGANLETIVECTDSVRFTITNNGAGAMNETLRFVVIEDAVMYMQVPDGPVLGVGESFTFTVPANGSTWRLEVEQEAFNPSFSSLQVALVEACGLNGTGGVSTGFAQMFSMFDDDQFIDVDCTDNIGSFDPNDKKGSPLGYGDDHFILPGTDLEYRIRFQNTGTDTAFNVVIRDTLSPMLDVASMRPGAASHPYQFETYGNGILKFTFPDIMLPDSNVNEARSHGFVEFKISHRPGLALGSVIENSAAIYFDFNEPVITNVTDHELAVDFLMVNQVRVAIEGVGLDVFPNPFGGNIHLQIEDIDYGKPLTFSLLDAFGKTVRSERFHAPGQSFSTAGLASGLYFFKVEMEGELVASGKLMRR